MVFLKLQPYIQSSVAPRANHKLLFKYYGPFRVIAKVSEVAYKLALPQGSTVHPVFHVSLLRQALSPGMSATSELPVDSDALEIPSKILDKRWRKKSNKTVEQVLVEWQPGTAASATWEDRQHLQDWFPTAPAWGQAGFQGGRGVRDRYSQEDSIEPEDREVEDPRASGGKTKTPIRLNKPNRERKPNPRYQGPEWRR